MVPPLAHAIIAIQDCIDKKLDQPEMPQLTLAQEVLWGDSKLYKAWLSKKHLAAYRAVLEGANMEDAERAAIVDNLMQKGLGSEVMESLEVARVVLTDAMTDARFTASPAVHPGFCRGA